MNWPIQLEVGNRDEDTLPELEVDAGGVVVFQTLNAQCKRGHPCYRLNFGPIPTHPQLCSPFR